VGSEADVNIQFDWLMVAAAPMALIVMSIIEALNTLLVGAMTLVGWALTAGDPDLEIVN
jgi:hypothetical protein